MSLAREREAVIEELFDAIDRKDTEAFLEHLTGQAQFRFGSTTPVAGHPAIGAAVGEFFGSVATLKHEVLNTLVAGDTMACEGEVTYTRHDGSGLTLPFCNVFEFDGSRIEKYRIYIDIAPLFAG